MIEMSLAEVATVVGGELHHDTGAGGAVVTGPAVVDSRRIEPGGLFVAFEGEHVDGHEFAVAAVEAGAAGVLGTRPVEAPCVVVPDAREALASLAHHVLARLDHVTVVGLTGSQGKTSTKDLLAGVLGTDGPTVATEGSFNNELGFPLTVLRATPTTRYLVLEMGARGRGHLAALCEVARPDVALVLNVGKAHLGEFGSQQAIAQAKGEIVDALPPSGTAVLNADDPLVAAMADRAPGRVVTFGESASATVRVEALTVDDRGRPVFDLVTADATAAVELPLLGEHQAANAAAAATTALALGLSLHQVAGALRDARAVSRWRMEVHERADGLLVVNDAYNANPDSMRSALKSLAVLGRARGGRTVAVLGPMRELGASSREEHDAIGRLAVRLDVAQLLVVGEEARPIHLGASLEGSWGGESLFVAGAEEALAWLRTHVGPSDVVLLKASRAAALETVADALLADPPPDAPADDRPEEPTP